VASRSTPWRTSTPPNDLRMPCALRAKVIERSCSVVGTQHAGVSG